MDLHPLAKNVIHSVSALHLRSHHLQPFKYLFIFYFLKLFSSIHNTHVSINSNYAGFSYFVIQPPCFLFQLVSKSYQPFQTESFHQQINGSIFPSHPLPMPLLNPALPVSAPSFISSSFISSGQLLPPAALIALQSPPAAAAAARSNGQPSFLTVPAAAAAAGPPVSDAAAPPSGLQPIQPQTSLLPVSPAPALLPANPAYFSWPPGLALPFFSIPQETS